MVLDAEGGISVPREMQRGRFKWFVGVMANITDCRSVAMSSILIRTANVVQQTFANFNCANETVH